VSDGIAGGQVVGVDLHLHRVDDRSVDEHGEIGDVTRFPTAGALCCWAGLTQRHYESDKTVHRWHISKEADTPVRWAAVEAIQRQTEPAVKAVKDGIVARCGNTARNIAKVAAAPANARGGLLRAARRPGPLPHHRGRGVTVTRTSCRPVVP
jgi:hypothetical protein